MTDGIALVCVNDELRPRGGAGGEVEEQGIGRAGQGIGHEGVGLRVGGFERRPVHPFGSDQEPSVAAGQVMELRRALGVGDDVPHLAPRHPVRKVDAAELRGRRHEDDTELHGGQQRLPQRRHIRKHEQQTVSAPGAKAAEQIGDAIAARAELRERAPDLGRLVVNQPEREAVVVGCVVVEPVQGPVESVEHRPAEIAAGILIALAVSQETIAGIQERLCGAHTHSWQVTRVESDRSSVRPTSAINRPDSLSQVHFAAPAVNPRQWSTCKPWQREDWHESRNFPLCGGPASATGSSSSPPVPWPTPPTTISRSRLQ